MFAQATGRTANPWTISISIAVQSALIVSAILLPLLRIEPLPPVRLAQMNKAPRHVDLVPVPKAIKDAFQRSSSALTFTSQRPEFTLPRQRTQSAEPTVDIGAFATELPDGPLTSGPQSFTPLGNNTPIVARPPVQPPKEKPAEPALTIDKPHRIGGDVKAPVLRSAPKPVYPPLARQARVQGTVRLNGIISRDGTVRSLELISGHPLLVSAALQAVRAWLYDPARLNGQPVDVILVIDVNFALSQ